MQRPVAEAEHAEFQLAAALPVGLLILEVRDAQELVRLVSGQLHGSNDILGLRHHGRVVLADEEGLLELGLVRFDELVPDDVGGAGRVEALVEPLVVSRLQVVLGPVADRFRIVHGSPQVVHLAQRRLGVVLGALAADAEGKGRGELEQLALDLRLLFGVEHAVEGADDGFAEERGLVEPRCLVIRLVDDDHVAQSGVVGPVLLQEAPAQVVGVLGLELLVAVPAALPARVWRIGVGVVAHARYHAEVVRVGFVQEAGVVIPRVVAVQPHGVGAQGPHDPEVVTAGPVEGAPEGLCVFCHEVVIRDPATRCHEWHRGVADALDYLLAAVFRRAGPAGRLCGCAGGGNGSRNGGGGSGCGRSSCRKSSCGGDGTGRCECCGARGDRGGRGCRGRNRGGCCSCR
mmetsp:Transcript_115726/g.373925  ORF Transcript_115726/g.373925 Transcript_115726/m.373925 type:complete len:402 (-) Transcript_115726:130-1335(-)